jgi:hypothetical protein
MSTLLTIFRLIPIASLPARQRQHFFAKVYGLNMKCPSQAHVLRVWLPVDGLLKNDWILRVLT